MTVTYFGVTAATVRAEYFPMWTAFTGNTNPTSTTITSSLIPQKYAELAGRLLVENVNAASVDADTASVGYSLVPGDVGADGGDSNSPVGYAADPELAKTYEARLRSASTCWRRTALSLSGTRRSTPGTLSQRAPTFITEMDISVPDDSLRLGIGAIPPKGRPGLSLVGLKLEYSVGSRTGETVLRDLALGLSRPATRCAGGEHVFLS